MEVVLSNDYNFYADGEIVNLDPPLPDGSVGAEDSRLVATIGFVAGRGTVSFAGPAQVLGLEYRPPVATYAPNGVARADFRYVPMDPDGINEGAPILYVDVAANREAVEYTGYGFAISARSVNGPAEITFDNGGFSAEADLAISESQTASRLGVLNDLDWYTAQIEWGPTSVQFSILSGSEAVLSWASTIHPTRAPLRHFRSGGFHSGIEGLFGNPVFTQVDNAYLAVDSEIIPPDITVTEFATRQFPRDDELGLGSAPRLVPPPRRGRVVGGYM